MAVQISLPQPIPFTLNLVAETTIYQNEVRCKIQENDFNYTQNPTAKSGSNYSADASATIKINTLGVTGDYIEIGVLDPILGNLLLGSYTYNPADTTIALMTLSIASAIASNPYGYNVSVYNNTITVTARSGLGKTINGGFNFLVHTTNLLRIFNKTFENTFN